MVDTLTQPPTAATAATEEWQPSPPPTDLVFDDGEPLESSRHRVAMNLLIAAYRHYRQNETDFYTGGNMFVYYSTSQVKDRDFRGPDFFVVLDVEGEKERQGWVVWEEGGRYPDTIVELMSPSTAKIDVTVKKDLYERVFKTENYFVYNPFDETSLQGWHGQGKYQPIERDDRGWLWCESLGLWLGTWQGTIDGVTCQWLRFYHRDGSLVLLPSEAALQLAETEAQRAEDALQLAKTEAQRAEDALQRADTEAQRADRLAARLRELGLDPDAI
jgi:Uma2 family endonuclease